MTDTEQLLRFQMQVIGGAFLEGFTESNVSNLTQEQKKALATIADILVAFKRQTAE